MLSSIRFQAKYVLYGVERGCQLTSRACFLYISRCNHATKVYERIKYCKLFKLLLQRNLLTPIIRVLVSLYTQ